MGLYSSWGDLFHYPIGRAQDGLTVTYVTLQVVSLPPRPGQFRYKQLTNDQEAGFPIGNPASDLLQHGSGGRIRTCDLWVMSGYATVSCGPTRTADLPRDQLADDAAVSALPPSTTAWHRGSLRRCARSSPARGDTGAAPHTAPPVVHHLRKSGPRVARFQAPRSDVREQSGGALLRVTVGNRCNTDRSERL